MTAVEPDGNLLIADAIRDLVGWPGARGFGARAPSHSFSPHPKSKDRSSRGQFRFGGTAYRLGVITTHDLNRFERYSVPDTKFEARLPELFDAFLEAARLLDLGQHPVSRQALRRRTSLAGSALEVRLTELGAGKIFDRTSLNLAVRLPLFEQARGAPAIWPNRSPIPAPGVEHFDEALPKAA